MLDRSNYGLQRSQSSSIIRYSELENRPTNLLSRTNSFHDANDYIRDSDRFTPRPSQFFSPNSQSLWTHRYYRPSYAIDSYWFDKYYYFSPLYKATQPYKRHYSSHRVTYPCSSNYPHVYWSRYKNYWYDDDNSSLYRRNYDPYYGDFQYNYRERYVPHEKNDVHLQNDVYPLNYHYPTNFYRYPVYVK